MFRLHIVQAAFGDCLLIEFGSVSKRRFMLVDGGPPQVYERHLRFLLQKIRAKTDTVDIAVLSHVHDDHAIGLLDYFAELRQSGNGAIPRVAGLWHNSFSSSIDPNGEIETRLRGLMTNTRMQLMNHAGMAVLGIEEGHKLRAQALAMQVPINNGFTDELILTDTAPAPVEIANAKIWFVGPSQVQLDALREEWEDWLEKNEDAIGNDDIFVMGNSDDSVPNLSSIMFLMEANGKSLLLTGDGRSDHVLQGLNAAGKLNAQGRLHVDVLKLMHHGSNRNVTKTFFKKITADTYVASANGKDDNPDLATLIWIVEAAKEQNREVKIVATNETSSIVQLQEEYPADEFGYTVELMPANFHFLTLKLA